MKKLLLYCFKILVIVVLMATVLDVLYTAVLLHTDSRNKIVNIYNSTAKEYEVVFLGSSRANNHFVPEIFNEKGLKSFNYGMSGSRLEESALMLKLMIERDYKIRNLILEVDLNVNSNGYSEGTRARFMPYLHQSEVIRNHYKNIPGFNQLYYVPFYRYIRFEGKIGFREVFFSLFEKPSSDLQHDGFYPLKSVGQNLSMDLKGKSPKRNVAYEEIREICQKHHIKLIAVTTPVCPETKNMAYFAVLSKLYPEIRHYEQSVNEDRYFSSCGHMNEAGANQFTAIILHDFLTQKL